MRKKKGGKKMNSTAAKVYEFSSRTKKKSPYTQLKPIKKLSEKETKSTARVLRDFDERD